MLFRLLLTALITTNICASPASPLIVDRNAVYDPINDSCQVQAGIIVNSGVFISAFSDSWTFVTDLVEVQTGGQFYFTFLDKKEGLQVQETFTNYNYGFVAILNPNFITDIYLSISGTTFENDGQMFVTGASFVDLSANTWSNTGSLVISGQVEKVFPVLTLESTGVLQNSGDIFLVNQYLSMDQQLYGGGCIHVIDHSLLFLWDINPSDPLDNIIVLDGSQALLGYTPCGSTTIVAGFGGNNMIEVCNENMLHFHYDHQSGILSITTEHFTDYFNIGLGYDHSKFKMGGGQIFYTDPPLNATPPQCGSCPPQPVAPGAK